MPALDFKEIPEAHIASGRQDCFEQFTSEALGAIGFKVIEQPARGPDLGKDLIVIEERKGIGRDTVIRWLVSCKHKAHSGRAVGLDDEPNIVERVESHNCDGFLGVYSTLPSSSLQERLKQLSKKFEVQVFDSAILERHLLSSDPGFHVAMRFFPDSMRTWAKGHAGPVELYAGGNVLTCDWCGRNLLDPPQGIYVVWRVWNRSAHRARVVGLHWSCKGGCDRRLSAQALDRFQGKAVSSWEDIPDLCIPIVYIKYVMAHLNRMKMGDRWSDDAFEKFKTLLLSVYPFVIRRADQDEEARVRTVRQLPDALGGPGF
jgi:hypothetical protein